MGYPEPLVPTVNMRMKHQGEVAPARRPATRGRILVLPPAGRGTGHVTESLAPWLPFVEERNEGPDVTLLGGCSGADARRAVSVGVWDKRSRR